MIKVLYDHQKFSEQRYGGISRYFANLIKGINANPGFEASVSMLYNTNHYLEHLRFPLNNPLGDLFFKSKPSRVYKWNKQYSKLQIGRNNFDLLHPTYYHPYFLKNLKRPYVLTVHDMINELFPDIFPDFERVKHIKQLTIQKASGIIAISESTKKDLCRILNTPEEKVSVIYHGIESQLPAVIKVDGLPTNYLLFVGERPNYKNFERLATCFAELRKQHNGLHLYCAGGGHFTDTEVRMLKDLKIDGHCLQANVSEGQLTYLYCKADAFIFPSLYEGFGYPLLEAFRAGCAVASSNTSCFKEVGGDAISYFDPHDTYDTYKAIDLLLSDSVKRAGFAAEGKERLKLFSLEKQVQLTLDFYAGIVNQSR